MLNKKLIFLLFSVFLGLLISFFYNKEFNEAFLLMSILITIIFYIIFYYLADIRNKENFINNNCIIEEESNTSINNNYIIEEESNPSINYPIIEEESNKLIDYNYIIEEELNMSDDIIQSTTNIEQPTKNIIQEEQSSLNNYVKPDLNKILMNNPIPNGNPYSPLNINISYNAQNSNNELDNNKTVSENKENSCMKNQNQTQTQNQNQTQTQNKNLGDYNDNTRIHNNSDWVYGNNAWTNNPDYYIPRKVPQQLNQLMNTKKNKENTVCPLMVNTPWTEYKSGDSDPEPYNL